MDKLIKQLEGDIDNYYDLGLQYQDFVDEVRLFILSKFTASVAMLWLLNQGECHVVSREEIEKLTKEFDVELARKFLTDSYVSEGLYNMDRSYYIVNVWGEDLGITTPTTGNKLIAAAAEGYKEGSMPLPTVTIEDTVRSILISNGFSEVNPKLDGIVRDLCSKHKQLAPNAAYDVYPSDYE